MGNFNHCHTQWKSLESAGGDDHQFLRLTHASLLNLSWNQPEVGML